MLGRVLRCLIDSMVFDAVVAEPGLLADVDRLTSARRLELLAAAETMREIGATPAAISRSSSAASMYGSRQRSSGITPR